jgi:hypothetical protein
MLKINIVKLRGSPPSNFIITYIQKIKVKLTEHWEFNRKPP